MHILLFLSVSFSCVASNIHGKARGHLALTGTAGLAVFDSPAIGADKEIYNVSWSVNSHAAVTEYRLYFRQQPRHHRGHHSNQENSNSSAVVTFRNEWNSVVIPGVANPQLPVPPPYPGVTRQKMFYLIKGLQSAVSYEVKVQARNSHGWNKLSPIFHFTTRSNGK